MKENYVADIKLRVDREMKRRVLELAAAQRTSEATIVRQAIDKFLGITPPTPAMMVSDESASYGKKASALLKKSAKAMEDAGAAAQNRGEKKIAEAAEQKGQPVDDGNFHNAGGLKHA